MPLVITHLTKAHNRAGFLLVHHSLFYIPAPDYALELRVSLFKEQRFGLPADDERRNPFR